MRIVIDMQGAQTESRFRGIGRYSLSFAQAVVRNRGDHEIILALNGLLPEAIESIRAAFKPLLPQENIRVWHAPGPVREAHSKSKTHRETAELIREAFLAHLRPDVIHISSLFEGYVDDAVTSIGRLDRNSLVSVSLYDLIPLLNPEKYLAPRPDYAAYYSRKINALRQASLMLSISEHSRTEGLRELGCAPEHIVNAGTAIDDGFSANQASTADKAVWLRRLGVTRGAVLYAGGEDERKNLPRLIEAWAALPDLLRHQHQLLLAGPMAESNMARFRAIADQCGLRADELIFCGYVTDEELHHLYRLCKLFVFPSWHEGFGLPALEAMACGAPVIGANTTSLPEVIGLNEALFDPFDTAAISSKMAEALQDDDFRRRLCEHGAKQAGLFCWDKTARRAISAWERLHQGIAPVQMPAPTATPKPSLAYVSPLPPERTGIADYSAELLPALAAFYDIVLIAEQEQPLTATYGNVRFPVKDAAWLRTNASSFDRVLYQMGNSPFHQHMLALLKEIPGVVVLHDFYLSGLLAWLERQGTAGDAWVSALYAAHGYGAVQIRHRDAQEAMREYPANWSVLQRAQGVIVHSEHSRALAQRWYGNNPASEWQIIPHVRTSARSSDRQAARKHLGISPDDFIVCSFGFLGPTKLNHRLLQAWLRSALAHDKRCRLIFVGENHGGEYGDDLIKTIRKSSLPKNIQITGFASPDLFENYLAAADLAVQLRTESRGETSGTVLDSMNHSLPVIVNGNGSMAELPADAVWMLADKFTDAALTEALDELWRHPARRHLLGRHARAIIHERHAPAACAHQYAVAIESFQRTSAASAPALIDAIAGQQDFSPEPPHVARIAAALADNLPLRQPAKRLFLDITATCTHDLKTGIERVARALTLALLEAPPPGYRIEPVYLSKRGGAWHYRYARRYTLELLGCPTGQLADQPIDATAGDMLFGLDISGDTLVNAKQEGLFRRYQQLGIPAYFLVHDLLPIRMPEVFPPGADAGHARWLEAVTSLDGAVCGSQDAAQDLSAWLAEAGIEPNPHKPYLINWSHHGADVSSSAPSKGLPDDASAVLAQLASQQTFLMVGTVEPRKGYLQALEAFTQLWNEDANVNLVIVGHSGWKGLPPRLQRDIPRTIERLHNHPELNKRLFWLQGISDEYLEKIYACSTCLIAASYGEGFGLPLIEAAQHKLPILARDLPVFREIAGEHACYFKAAQPSDLAQAVRDWLALARSGQFPRSDRMPWLTWKESAARLKEILLASAKKEMKEETQCGCRAEAPEVRPQEVVS